MVLLLGSTSFFVLAVEGDPPQDAHRTFDHQAQEVLRLLTTPNQVPTSPSPPSMEEKDAFLKSFDEDVAISDIASI